MRRLIVKQLDGNHFLTNYRPLAFRYVPAGEKITFAGQFYAKLIHMYDTENPLRLAGDVCLSR